MRSLSILSQTFLLTGSIMRTASSRAPISFRQERVLSTDMWDTPGFLSRRYLTPFSTETSPLPGTPGKVRRPSRTVSAGTSIASQTSRAMSIASRY